ncbi:MAG: thioredoxin family protein [Methanoregula sp.]
MDKKTAGIPVTDAQKENSLPPEQQNEPAAIPVEVNDQTWERTVEKSKIPVAVMFYSPTCAFCHQMDPYFRNYAGEYKGSVLFVRLNILSSQWTAERYGIRSTPTFKFYCDGRPVREMVGAVYPALLKKEIDEVLIHGKECRKNSTLIDYEITGYG